MMLEMPSSPSGQNISFASFGSSFGTTSGHTGADAAANASRRSSVYAQAAQSALSKEAADRAVDKIISYFTADTPRSTAQLKTWMRAKQIHTDVRNSLLEIGWKLDSRTETSATEIAAGKLFPAAWFDILNEELLADLIVDSFASTVADAFVDGAVCLFDAEAKNGYSGDASRQATPRLPGSSSEPLLRHRSPNVSKPLAALKTPFATMPPHGDFARNERRPSGGRLVGAAATAGSRIAGPRQGFPQAGLPQDEREAWQRTHYHACQPLQDFKTRIHMMTELQRPRRQLRRQPEGTGSQTKYVWPSTKYHFPDSWDAMTQKRRNYRATGEIIEEPNPVLTVKEDGKSQIPYSLVLHKAFIESQPPGLREKAAAIVPLKLTQSAADLT